MNRWTSALLALIAFAWLSAVSVPARAGEEEAKRAENAVRVLKEVMMAPTSAFRAI